MIKRLLLSFLLCFAMLSFANTPAPDGNTPTKLPKGMITCPPADKLVKNKKNRWLYKGDKKGKNFKSFNTSFAKKIKHFVGAQWQGVKVGKVECVYQPENAYTFTVILYFGHLTHEPTSKAWSKNKGGFRNCLSLNPKDCYFDPVRKPKSTNPYNELESVK